MVSVIQNGFRTIFQKSAVVRQMYKSAISLDTIYPKSSLKLTTPTFVPDPKEKFSGLIPMDKMQITYSCASGPGGQNVNKVHTKVDLRFKVAEAKWLHPEVREKLAEQCKSRITKDGFLVLKSDVTRSQQLNVADCLQKLREMIRIAAQPVPQTSPETLEKIRRRQEKAARERLMLKRQNSEKRALRQAPGINDL